MNSNQIAQKVLREGGGVARTADFAAAGLERGAVAALCRQGLLERVRRGVYQRPGGAPAEERLLKQLLPQGIVCLESALFHYGYSDFVPRAWSVAMPRSDFRAVDRIEEFPVKAYYVSKEFFPLGRTVGRFDGVELAVYDRERTICDCFKYRAKLDSETFSKALHAYAADDRKNLANLSGYARKMGLYGKMMSVMGVLLGG